MNGDMTYLNALVQKYRDQVESLESQLAEARRKFTLVSETIDLLKREGVFDQQELFETPTVTSDKYKELGMREAILDILNQYGKVSADGIYEELIKHGFQTSSKNLKRDLYTRLFRLKKGGIVISKKEGKVKKYSLPKPKEETKVERYLDIGDTK